MKYDERTESCQKSQAHYLGPAPEILVPLSRAVCEVFCGSFPAVGASTSKRPHLRIKQTESDRKPTSVMVNFSANGLDHGAN